MRSNRWTRARGGSASGTPVVPPARCGCERCGARTDPRRRGLLRAAAGGVAAGLLAPAGVSAQGEARPGEWPALTLLDGTSLAPSSWRGQAAVLVVWSTTCPFCRRHNPHVEKLHRAVAGRPMRVLGAALDTDPEVVRRYAREQGYTFPITLQAELLRTRFGLRRAIPMTVTFDRSGRLLQRIPGEMFEEDVLELAQLAEGRA
jgi:thiol-disulfide isomerase/thioredoxin